MAVYKTEGIVIKRTNLGEADRILTIFTRERGKIRVVAKGIRRSKSKMAGHLERFNRSKLMVAEGKNLDVLTGAELIEPFDYSDSLLPVAKAYYMAELIDELIHDEFPHQEVYKLITAFLQKIREDNELLIPYLEINLLSLLGFRPELSNCVVCHQKLEVGGSALLVEQGGFTHEKCFKGLVVEDDIIKVLRVLLSSDISIIDRLKLSSEIEVKLKQIVSLFITHQIGKELKSQRFLREILSHS